MKKNKNNFQNKDVLDLDQLRVKFLEYTRKAFRKIPPIKEPKILDVGCGTGVPTLELEKLSGGEIIAMDINHKDLEKLEKKIQEKGLGNKIYTIHGSLLKYNFEELIFDIIWAEAVLHIIGFKKGLKACYSLLKPGGFLVLHEEIKKFKPFLEKLDTFGLKVYESFKLPEEIWWDGFYKPMEKEFQKLLKLNPNLKNNKQVKQFEPEINMVKENPKKFDSAFYILQKPKLGGGAV